MTMPLPTPKGKKKNVTLSLDLRRYLRFREIITAKGMSVSSVVDNWIERFLESDE